MNWPRLLISIIFIFITGASLFVWPIGSQQIVYEHWSRLKPDAPKKEYDAVITQCRKKNQSIEDLVRSFVHQKQDAAIYAVNHEWALSKEQLIKFQKNKQAVITHMKREDGENICQGPRRFQKVVAIVKAILAENGIHNIIIKIVTGAKESMPYIFYDDYLTNSTQAQFILSLPPYFASYDESIQRGVLEHELMHLKACHGKFTKELVHYLAERESCLEDQIMDSESMQKWMRACEYEADLMPAVKNSDITMQLICVLKRIKIMDELHPPTRKRIKMLKRVQRLHEANERLKLL